MLFAATAFFKKANEVEAGHLDEVDAHVRTALTRLRRRAGRRQDYRVGTCEALVLRGFVRHRGGGTARSGARDRAQVVVEVIATGICGSDFHGYSGENGRRHPGQVMGHETVGRIDELGPDVEALSGWPAGHQSTR